MMSDIPVVSLTATPSQSGGAVKRKPGRPKGSRDKAKRAPRKRKSTPYPRSKGPSEAVAAARRRLREAERVERDVFESGVRNTRADGRLRRELQLGRITPAEARAIRRDEEREMLEEARVERLLEQERREARETRRIAEREGERTRESARALGKQTRKAIAASPIRTRAGRLAAGAAHPSPLHSPGGLLSSVTSGLGAAASGLAGLVTPSPAPPPFPGASGFTPSGAPSPLPKAPPPKRKGDGVPEPEKKKPCECHYKSHAGDHVTHVCKQSMNHAEKHGKKACRDHMRELKGMQDRIKETRRYIRSLPK